jgi:hypothetical protein
MAMSEVLQQAVWQFERQEKRDQYRQWSQATGGPSQMK